MQFSEKWLREWVNPEVNTEQLVDALTMLGLEVDAVTPAAGDFSGVVVAKVMSREPHPNADRLSLCQVDTGEGEWVQVVCGAPNVRQDLKVAFVKVGGVLPGDFKIKQAKLRGVESFGMICSTRELGLGDDHEGILELPADAPIGANIRDYLQLNDFMIDVDLTPDRGDCASVHGIAQDLSAKYNLPITSPESSAVTSESKTQFSIEVNEPAKCPRYVGRVIENLNPQTVTPMWMQERLRRSGLRLVHPVVDIGNYVMLELGQPMHAFDLDKLAEKIVVRDAKPQEKITLLDGAEFKLEPGMLVIADANGAQAVAGVMGAAASAVDEKTARVFLESAFFQPQVVLVSSRQLGVTTDSSYRFERGVDYLLQQKAIERFSELLLQICGGEVAPVQQVVAEQHLPKVANILLRREQISRLLGITLPDAQVEQILTRLGMVLQAVETGWQVTVSSQRFFDIRIEVDLIEELARIYGYDQIPAATQIGRLKIPLEAASAQHFSRLRLNQFLTDLGYHEAVCYSFVSPDIQRWFDPDGSYLTLSNPLSKEMSVMRTSLWPGLVQALAYNLNRQLMRVRLFESGLCFIQQGDELQQVERLAGVIAGPRYMPQWSEPACDVDFYDIKGDIEKLFAELNRLDQLSWRPSQHSALHPGQSADVILNDQCVGSVGALHPTLVEKLGLSLTPFLFELSMAKICSKKAQIYEKISKFPAVRRDLAIVIDDNVTSEVIENHVRELAGHLLLEFKIFDIYHGEGIEFGKKSVALGLTFQDPSRTLVDEEVNTVVRHVVEGLQHELQAILRA